MDHIELLYAERFGSAPGSVLPLAGEGSNRCYFRVNGVTDCIATVGVQRLENEAFIYLSRYFLKRGLPVPEVLAVSDDRMTYLQSDVGTRSIYDEIVTRGAGDPTLVGILESVMRLLPRFQYSIDDEFDSAKCFPVSAMDRRAIMWDLNYFKYCFLKSTGLEIDEVALENDFESLAEEIAYNPANTLLLRDFQSRNVMTDAEGNLSVIDFQGARLGDGLYDVASFVWQARANYPDELKKRLVDAYKSGILSIGKSVPADFDRRLALMVFFRSLQVLGAYGFRGFVEQKAKFLMSIPQAVRNLQDSLEILSDSFCPYLKALLNRMVALESLQPVVADQSLTVTVMSFSYKKGIPKDMSGNGGGFVFDCRGLHNPGRYDEYKPLTGRDQAVIDFLEDRGEIQTFLTSCYALVDASVECYLRRGFSSLMVCFGCTGGRHRSVYSAEHMADHLVKTFGVRVYLVHREQAIDEIR